MLFFLILSYLNFGNGTYKDIKITIEKFYDLSYESLMDLEMKDMSSVLNEESKFGRNYINYFKNGIVEEKYEKEKGYGEFERIRLPITISVTDVKVEDDNAKVRVDIGGMITKHIPCLSVLEKTHLI